MNIDMNKVEYKRILKFGAVGGSGIFVNMGLLWFLTNFVGLYYLTSGVIAIEASILSNFVLNDIWTFRDRRNGIFLKRMLKFNFARLIAMVINFAILWILTLYGIHYLISNLVGVLVATSVTYTSSSWWVWKRK